MKKIGVCVLAVILFVTNVKAASKCSYAEEVELNELAGKIKANYEVKDVLVEVGEDAEVDNYYDSLFEIIITNVSDKFYIVVENDNNNTKTTYTAFDAKNNVISFEQNEMNSVVRYNINVYSSDKTGCKDEIYKTLYLTLPRYNPYSRHYLCKGLEDNSLCQKYVETEQLDESEFISRMEKYTSEQKRNDIIDETNNNKTLLDILLEYKYYIIACVSLIAIASIVIIAIKLKKRKELGV